jgi:hypothetical protein
MSVTPPEKVFHWERAECPSCGCLLIRADGAHTCPPGLSDRT